MSWEVVDEFDKGDFNISLNKNVSEPGYYSISIASEEDEVWLDIDDILDAWKIFDLLFDHCVKAHTAG